MEAKIRLNRLCFCSSGSRRGSDRIANVFARHEVEGDKRQSHGQNQCELDEVVYCGTLLCGIYH
jgi:hypothetical protein